MLFEMRIALMEDGKIAVDLQNKGKVRPLEIAGVLGFVQQNMYDVAYGVLEGKNDSETHSE